MRMEYSSKRGLQRDLNGRYGTHVSIKVLLRTQSEQARLLALCTVENQLVNFLIVNPTLSKGPNWKILGQQNSPCEAPSRDN